MKRQQANSEKWQRMRFQSTRLQLNQLAMYGKVPNFPHKPKMVQVVPVPPVAQWVPLVQKSKSEKKACRGNGNIRRRPNKVHNN
ncbi:hypothetical protein M5689_015271 [Euphorbia peplus]|nr:hypothetical protein M5689_015271 [Euphorbia peplus]